MLTILVIIGFSGGPRFKSYPTEAECLNMKQALIERKFEAFCLPVTADKLPHRKE